MRSLAWWELSPTHKLARTIALQGGALSPTSFRAQWTPYCDTPSRLQRRERGGKGFRSVEVVADVPCRHCEKCLQFRQMQWRERAVVEIREAPRSWFMTLTFDDVMLAGVYAMSQKWLPAKPSEGERLKAVDRAAYAHLQRYLKRLRKGGRVTFDPMKGKQEVLLCEPRALRFLAVFELGEQTARPHYHLLLHEVDRPIPSRWLEARWPANVSCRLVRSSEGSASYVTKYLTKSRDISPRASVGYGETVEERAARLKAR